MKFISIEEPKSEYSAKTVFIFLENNVRSIENYGGQKLRQRSEYVRKIISMLSVLYSEHKGVCRLVPWVGEVQHLHFLVMGYKHYQESPGFPDASEA